MSRSARATVIATVATTGMANRLRRANVSRAMSVPAATPVQTDRSQRQQRADQTESSDHAGGGSGAASPARRCHAGCERTHVKAHPVGDGVCKRASALSVVEPIIGIEDVLGPDECVHAGQLKDDRKAEVGTQNNKCGQERLALSPGRVDHRRQVEDQEREYPVCLDDLQQRSALEQRVRHERRADDPRASPARARSGPVGARHGSPRPVAARSTTSTIVAAMSSRSGARTPGIPSCCQFPANGVRTSPSVRVAAGSTVSAK